MADGGDAEAYSLQVNAKQDELIEEAGGLEEHPELASTQIAEFDLISSPCCRRNLASTATK